MLCMRIFHKLEDTTKIKLFLNEQLDTDNTEFFKKILLCFYYQKMPIANCVDSAEFKLSRGLILWSEYVLDVRMKILIFRF